MKNKYCLILIITALFFGCGQNSTTSQKTLDSLTPPADTDKIQRITTVDIDTTGLSNAPIKILKSSMKIKSIDTIDQPADNLHHEGHFKRFITIKLTYKNVSSKRIIGAELRWVLIDKNGKPASIESNTAGIGFGYMGSLAKEQIGEYSFGIGKTSTDEWQQGSPTATKIKLVYAAKVQFYDNSTWQIGKK